MEHHNQAKITIQQGKRNGTELLWSEVFAEKQFGYFSEAKEAIEMISWTQAEEIAKQKLDITPALLIKAWRNMNNNQWNAVEERVLLTFVEETT